MILLDSDGGYSKSEVTEFLLPIIFVLLIIVNNKTTWIIFVSLLIWAMLDIYWFNYYSSFYSIFLVTNPLLELSTYYGLGKTLFRFLFFFPSIAFPISLITLLTKRFLRTYKVIK